MHLEVRLAMLLPRDQGSVPIVRRIVADAMRHVGVEAECIEEISLSLTEACANVLEHSHAEDAYEVTIHFDERVCKIRVVDEGDGADLADLAGTEVDLTAESGRGIAMMRALMDMVHFESKPTEGTIVNLEKRLRFDEAHPVRRRVTTT